MAHHMQHALEMEVHRSPAGGSSSSSSSSSSSGRESGGGACTTLHGILRAPHADGKESLVIVTPAVLTPGECAASPGTHCPTSTACAARACVALWGPAAARPSRLQAASQAPHPSPHTSGPDAGDAPPAGAPLLFSATSLFLSHLRFSPHATWLAKDVIWVVPDARCEGSLAALERWTRAYQVG